MVVGAQPKPQPQSQPQTQQPPQHQPEPSPEDEALKRNTDCVYFLASPVSCKKGGECEYRHSEHALYNPRDCWFWLNGNCLNLKCSFRHPPLDGLLGSPAASSAGPSLPLPQTATTPATNATFNSSKQAVPCIFFQRGFCSKADKCPFSHGPNSIASSKAPQAAGATHGTEPSSLKKVFGGIQKWTQENKIPQVSASKIAGAPPQSKPAPKVLTAPSRNGVGIQRNVLVSRDFDDDAPRYKPRSVLPAMNGDFTGQASHFLQPHVPENHGFQNGKDVDEHLRESSPGFDVLVDDERGDSDYYHGEEQFGRARGHDGRNLNSLRDYDLDRPADYNSITDGDRERFRDSRGYDLYDQMQGRYAWDQQRGPSSERLLVGAAHSERRGYRKSDSPDNIDGSDLRHRLSKHRRGNGLRSIISNDYDGHVEEQKNGPRRDSQQLPSHEGALSSRLRGRIKLPGGSTSVNGSDLRPEREADRGRSRDRRDRLSPRRPQVTSYQGRLRDRVQGRVPEDYNNDGRSLEAPRMSRETVDERSTEFSRLKRLPELKGGTDAAIKEHSYLEKPNNVNMDSNQQSEGYLSFEGPKPLSEILKRKREAEAAAASGSRKRSSVNKPLNNEKEGAVSNPGGSKTGAVTMMHSGQPLVAKEETKSGTTDAAGTENEKIDLVPGQSSQGHNDAELETEDGLIYDATLEEHELEGEDQREGEYEYEQGEDGEYAYEEGENADGEEEYLEEEDGDDFAKKIGVMFS